MLNDALTRQAMKHTLHCLLGCSIGEVLGMAIGTALDWPNVPTTILAIVLAFFFGYLLTFLSFQRSGATKKDSVKGALATDTASITSMEFFDNLFLWLIPGAMDAKLTSGLFWGSLALALSFAFVLTVPINRWLMSRGIGHGHHHH